MSSNNNNQYVRTQVNTKSLLGRPALIEMLQEDKKGTLSPDDQDLQKQPVTERAKHGRAFSFNNNIYNNYNPNHMIESVSPAKRLLPKVDQQRIDLIKKLKTSGKIKSLGRSDVPLHLYEEANALDHLYITTVTKHVPVAHDQQLQSDSQTSPKNTNNQAMTSTGYQNSGMGSKLGGRDSVGSPQLLAQQELQHILNQGYQITDNRVNKADIKEAMHRSLDKFNRTGQTERSGQSPPRMVGDVSVVLPPGFGLKSPSKDLQLNNSSVLHNQTTDRTNHDQSIVTGPDAVFVSNASIPNHQMDSLFQEPSHHQQSLMDQQAMSSHRSPQPTGNTIYMSKEEFQQSQGFRSVVRQTTHQEINEMIRAANPQVYEQQRRENELNVRNRRSNNHSVPKKTIKERKDSFAAILRQNKWHAPVKKHEIMQRVLDGIDEPRDTAIDMAIMAHQIQQFGTEQDSKFDRMVEARRADGVLKYGTASIRKQTKIKLKEYFRKQEQERKEKEAQEKALFGKALLGEDLFGLHSQLTDSLEKSSMVNDDEKMQTENVETVEEEKPKSSLGGMFAKKAMEMKMRIGFTSALLGKPAEVTPHSSKSRLQQNSASRQGSVMQNAPAILGLPKINMNKLDSVEFNSEAFSLPNKIKPNLLADRRAKRAKAKKMSLSHHRSSKLSFQTNDMSYGGGTRTVLQSGLTTQQDAELNVERIHEMLAKLDVMEGRTIPRGMAQTLQPGTPVSRDLQYQSSAATNPIFNIPLGGSFSQRKPQGLKVAKLKKQITIKAATQVQSTRNQRSGSPSPKRKSLSKKRIKSLSPKRSPSPTSKSNTIAKKTTMTEKKIKNLTFAAASPVKFSNAPENNYYNTMPTASPEREDPAKIVAREKYMETCNANNDIIKQLLKTTAQLLQRPDSEARFLRNNVIQPSQLGKYNLRKFIGKTIMLNVGSLYQPLKFKFTDFAGEFNVYLSHKQRIPNTENGFEQKATNPKLVVFPIAQEHLSPNMFRYSKDKVLYITMESTHDCCVGITVDHNKKDAPNMTVTSIHASSENVMGMGGRKGSMTSLGSSLRPGSQETATYLNEQQLAAKAEESVAALKLMLGGDDKTLHASKANAMTKKKISYMINEDLDVAKDFLELVDILKQHKSQVNKALKANILQHNSPRNEPMSPVPQDEIYVENQGYIIDPVDGTMKLDDIMDGFQHLFSTDLYSSFKNGQLTHAQYTEMRAEQNKQKKKEILEMTRLRALKAVTKTQHRQELKQQIVANLQKQAADRAFTTKWRAMFLVRKACLSLAQLAKQKKENAHFQAQIFWTLLKMKINLSIRLKRTGPTPEERLRRQIRDSLVSIGSAVHLKDVTAAKNVKGFLEMLHTRLDLKAKVIETGLWVRHIQERFRQYWQVRTEQMNFIVRMIKRERERIQIAMIKDPDAQMRQIGWLSGRLTDETILQVASTYYRACQSTYEPIFFAWRNKIAQFKAEGLDDLTAGYHYPFMAPRGIDHMDDINYDVVYKKKSLQKYLEQASKKCRAKFKYYMNVQEEEDSDEEEVKSRMGSRGKSAPSNSKTRKPVADARAKQKLLKTNKEYATLAEAIAKQEDQFKAEIIHDLKNCAYFPPRPAMKFIPSPIMTHQLIHQALMLQHTKLEAPDSFKDTYDEITRVDSSIRTPTKLTGTTASKQELPKSQQS